ncbi:MAG: DUF4912 domain-containing protein [Treponema sp.]|nr:DUF4912 domain-containing protein [Treponema sp.]
MDFPGFNTQYLERLSTDELIVLAEKNGLDIPSDLERVFIIEELLYLDRDGIAGAEETGEHTLLLKQYPASIIKVLVRDPLWAFVFWEIKGQSQNDDYCLRVIPFKEDGVSPDMAGSFTVAVGADDSSWYLGFPPDKGCLFTVELCVSREEGCLVLASSHPFKMPRLIKPKHDGDGELQAVYRNPMAQLSGVERFPLLRSMDRLLRSKRGI